MHDHLACELCLMLENALHLLSEHTPELDDVKELASCMAGAVSQMSHCILAEHASLLSLAARCTMVIVLASMHCRCASSSHVVSGAADFLVRLNAGTLAECRDSMLLC